jgi:hypothetical protein
LHVYAAILHVYAAILRMYADTLHVYAAILLPNRRVGATDTSYLSRRLIPPGSGQTYLPAV